jgi:hypothetical protein
MIKNYNLILLSGGRYHCDKSWSRKAIGTDRCCSNVRLLAKILTR